MLAEISTESANWMLNSGCNLYICSQKKSFVDLLPEGCTIQVEDKQIIYSMGHKLIRGITIGNGARIYMTLQNDSYASNIVFNLVSLPMAKKFKFCIKIDDDESYFGEGKIEIFCKLMNESILIKFEIAAQLFEAVLETRRNMRFV